MVDFIYVDYDIVCDLDFVIGIVFDYVAGGVYLYLFIIECVNVIVYCCSVFFFVVENFL